MFDIGFLEVLLIAVVALLVLGPERLPHAIRMTSAFMGKARRMMANVREEFEREVQLAEMQERIKEQLEKAGIEDARKALEDTRQNLEEAHTLLSSDISALPTHKNAPDTTNTTNTTNAVAGIETAKPAPPEQQP